MKTTGTLVYTDASRAELVKFSYQVAITEVNRKKCARA